MSKSGIESLEATNILSDSSYEVPASFQPRTISPSDFESPSPSEQPQSTTHSTNSPNSISEDLPLTTKTSSLSSSMNFAYGNRTPDMLSTLGSKTAPRKFTGNFKKVKDFLEKYDRMCNAYHVTDPDKCLRLKDYCSDSVTQLIESLASYVTSDWLALKADLLDYYDADLKETRHNIGHMRKLVLKWRTHPIASLQKWKKFRRQFKTISGWLLQQGRISEQEQATYYWHGIHKNLRNKIEATLTARDPTIDLTRAFPMDDIDGIVTLLFTRNRFDSNLVESENESDSESDDSSSESESSSSTSGSESDSESSSSSDSDYKSRKHSKHTKGKKKKLRKTSNRKKESRKTATLDKALRRLPTDLKSSIKKPSLQIAKKQQNEVVDLIDKMGRLSISDPDYKSLYYQAIKLDKDVEKCIQAPAQALQAATQNYRQNNTNNYSRPMRINNIGLASTPATLPNSIPLRQGMLENRGQCFGCNQEGHSVRNCPEVQSYINKGVVRQEQFGNRLQLGNGTPIIRHNGETLVQAIQRYTAGTAVQANFIGLECETEETETPQIYAVSENQEIYPVTRTVKTSKQSRKDITDNPKSKVGHRQTYQPAESSRTQRFKARLEKSDNQKTTTTKEKTRNKEITESDSEPEPTYETEQRYNPQEVSDIEMEDEPPTRGQRHIPIKTKEVRQGPKPKVRQSEIQKQVPPDTLINKLLETEVPKITVKELIACSELLSNKLGGMLKRKNISQEDYEEAEPAVINLLTRNKALLIRIDMTSAGHSLEAVVDCGSQLNIMKRSIYEKYLSKQYPEERDTIIKVKDASGNEGILQGRVPKVRLEKGSIQTYANLYLGSDDLPFDLLLGRPWQRDNFVGIDERNNGTYLVFRDIQQPHRTMELCVMREVIDKPWQMTPSLPKETEAMTDNDSDTDSESDNEVVQAIQTKKSSSQKKNQQTEWTDEAQGKYLDRGYVISSLEVVSNKGSTTTSSESEAPKVKEAIQRRNRQKRRNLLALENYLRLINRRGSAGVDPLWSSDELAEDIQPFESPEETDSESEDDCPPLLTVSSSEVEESSDMENPGWQSTSSNDASKILSISEVDNTEIPNIQESVSQIRQNRRQTQNRQQHEFNESLLRNIEQEFYHPQSDNSQATNTESPRRDRTHRQERHIRLRRRPLSIRIVQEVSIEADDNSTDQEDEPPLQPSPSPWLQGDWPIPDWTTSEWADDGWPNENEGHTNNRSESRQQVQEEDIQQDILNEINGVTPPYASTQSPHSPSPERGPLMNISNMIESRYEPRLTQSWPGTLCVTTEHEDDQETSNTKEIEFPVCIEAEYETDEEEFAEYGLEMEFNIKESDISTDSLLRQLPGQNSQHKEYSQPLKAPHRAALTSGSNEQDNDLLPSLASYPNDIRQSQMNSGPNDVIINAQTILCNRPNLGDYNNERPGPSHHDTLFLEADISEKPPQATRTYNDSQFQGSGSKELNDKRERPSRSGSTDGDKLESTRLRSPLPKANDNRAQNLKDDIVSAIYQDRKTYDPSRLPATSKIGGHQEICRSEYDEHHQSPLKERKETVTKIRGQGDEQKDAERRMNDVRERAFSAISQHESGNISMENQQNLADIPKKVRPTESSRTTTQCEIEGPGPGHTDDLELRRTSDAEEDEQTNELKTKQGPDDDISRKRNNSELDAPNCATRAVTLTAIGQLNAAETAKELNERTTLEQSLIRTTGQGASDDDQATMDVRSPDQATERGERKDKRSFDELAKVPSEVKGKRISTQKTGGAADAPNSNEHFHDNSTTAFPQTLGTAYQAANDTRIDQKAGKACDGQRRPSDDQNFKNERRSHTTDDTGDGEPISEWLGDVAAYVNEEYKMRGKNEGENIQQTKPKSNQSQHAQTPEPESEMPQIIQQQFVQVNSTVGNFTDAGASDDDRQYAAAIPLAIRPNSAPRPAVFPASPSLPTAAGLQLQHAVTSTLLQTLLGPQEFHGTIIVCPTSARLPTRVDGPTGFRLDQHLLVNGRIVTIEPGRDPAVRIGHTLVMQANGVVTPQLLSPEEAAYGLPSLHHDTPHHPTSDELTHDGRVPALGHFGAIACLDFQASDAIPTLATAPDWKVNSHDVFTEEDVKALGTLASELDQGEPSSSFVLFHAPPFIPLYPAFTSPSPPPFDAITTLLTRIPFLEAARRDHALNGPTLGAHIEINFARLAELTHHLPLEMRNNVIRILVRITEVVQSMLVTTNELHRLGSYSTPFRHQHPGWPTDPDETNVLTLEGLGALLCDPHLFRSEIDLPFHWDHMPTHPSPRRAEPPSPSLVPADAFQTFSAEVSEDQDGEYSADDEMDDTEDETPLTSNPTMHPPHVPPPTPVTDVDDTMLAYPSPTSQMDPSDYYQETVEDAPVPQRSLKKPIFEFLSEDEDTRIVVRTDQRHPDLRRIQVDIDEGMTSLTPTEIATDEDTTVSVLYQTTPSSQTTRTPAILAPADDSSPPRTIDPRLLMSTIHEESDPESDSDGSDSDSDMDTSDSYPESWDHSTSSNSNHATRGSSPANEQEELNEELPELLEHLDAETPMYPHHHPIKQFHIHHPQHPFVFIRPQLTMNLSPDATFVVRTQRPDSFGHVDISTVHKRLHRKDLQCVGEVIATGRVGHPFTDYSIHGSRQGHPIFHTIVFTGQFSQHPLQGREDNRAMHMEDPDHYGPPRVPFTLRGMMNQAVYLLYDTENIVPSLVPFATGDPLDYELTRRIAGYRTIHNECKARRDEEENYPREVGEENEIKATRSSSHSFIPYWDEDYIAYPFADHPRPHIQALRLHYPALQTEEMPFWTKGPLNFLDPSFDPRRLFSRNAFTREPALLKALRAGRYCISFIISALTEWLMLSEVRQLIDERPVDDPTRHFFYYHCPTIRFLNGAEDDLKQGFNTACIHFNQDYRRGPREEGPILMPLFVTPPTNALLTWEEDEFLFHMAKVFDQNRDGELGNICRQILHIHIFYPDHVQGLLDEGYLDPIHHHDYLGHTFSYIDQAI